MPNDSVITPTPEAVDPSFDDLESMLSGGGQLAAPVAEAPPEPAATLQQTPPEAAPVKTPAAEPDKKPEGKENIPETKQDPEPPQPVEVEGKPKKDKLADIAFKRRKAERETRAVKEDLEHERAETERLRRRLEALETGSPASDGKPADGKPASTSSATTTAGQFEKPKPSLKEDFVQPGGKHFKEGEDYEETVQRFQEAYSDWRDEKREFTSRQEADTKSAVEVKKTFVKDIELAMDEHPDFEDARDYVLANAPEQLQVAISNLPRFSKEKASWPEIVMYLNDNPDELDTLKALHAENQIAAIAELGRIYHSLKPATGKTAQGPTPVAQPPKPPKVAPTPPAVVGGHAAPAPVNLDDCDFETFAREVPKYLPAR